jgi:transcriptional regulator with XRE-family HTH domain
MKTGAIITELRKKMGWSQSDLANKTDISQVMVGKYERGDAAPSIEVAKKIADAFGVSLDYLVGEGQNMMFDKRTLKRLQDIEQMKPDLKEKLYFVIDSIIRDSKAMQAYVS